VSDERITGTTGDVLHTRLQVNSEVGNNADVVSMYSFICGQCNYKGIMGIGIMF